MSKDRFSMLWAGVLIAIGCWITAGSAFAQVEERSLIVWVDTINLNVCEGREFDSLGVWLESFVWNEELERTDRYVGFRSQDSVLAVTMTLQWDTSRIRLQPPYILVPPQTLFGRFPTKVQSVDTTKGTLYVSVAASENLRIVVGKDIPLFYLKGRVRAVDTVNLPDGGAMTQYLDIEGKLGDNVGTVDFQPGFVRVIRDTTPEYTGRLRVSDGMLDTNRLDTIFVIADNLADRRVNEVRFALKGDRDALRFVDTVATGMLSSSGIWRSRRVEILEDSIFAEFIADEAIAVHDSTVIGIVVERATDSGFSSKIDVTEFGINPASCLGKLESFSGQVTAAKIPEKDTTTSVLGEETRGNGTEIVVIQRGGSIQLTFETIVAEEVLLYDMTGRVVGQWSGMEVKTGMEIGVGDNLKRGTYFLMIRDKDRRIWYKQIIIQTN